MVPKVLPLYQCHKKVSAAKIERISTYGSDWLLHFGTGLFRQVSEEYFHKHNPKVGGYFVEYEDGYQSYSPA